MLCSTTPHRLSREPLDLDAAWGVVHQLCQLAHFPDPYLLARPVFDADCRSAADDDWDADRCARPADAVVDHVQLERYDRIRNRIAMWQAEDGSRWGG